MQAIKGFLASKKFWVMLAGLIGIPAASSAGMDQKTLMWQVLIATAYLIAQGLADFGKSAAQAPEPSAVPQAPPAPTPPVLPLLGLMLCGLLTSGCGLLSGAKPYISSAEDAARAMCAVYASEKKSITIEDAFKDFCAVEENWGPFLAAVKEKQAAGKAGVTLKVAALPDDCAEVKK